MSGYNDFMRRAHGRNHELERRLRESSEPRLAKVYRLIYGNAIEASDLVMAESLASTLKTSIDDEYVVDIVLSNHARNINADLHRKYYRECKLSDYTMTLASVFCFVLFAIVTYLSFDIKNKEEQILSIISASGKNHTP